MATNNDVPAEAEKSSKFSTVEFFENFKMISEDDVKSLYLHGDDITKEKALEYCSSFLGGSWSTLTVDNFSIQVLQ